jgi:hypothetical protein
MSKIERYNNALVVALMLMGTGVEPRSALKEAGNQAGIPYGDEMGAFVKWAEEKL